MKYFCSARNSIFNNLNKDQTIRFIMIMQMLDFAFEPINSKDKRCGCYALNPELLTLYYQNHRILVPLRSCEYQIEIVNAMVNVTLVQTYQNPTDKFLQVEYSFPISPNACVYRFVAIFGNKRIEGIIKEKQEAKQQYTKAVSEGKKAAYGQLNAESKDILNLRVGNIGPKQEVKIEIVYLQQLNLGYNTFYQLHLPATITPRYFSNIPSEQILAGYRNVSSQETFGTFNWIFQISLRTTRKVTFHDSHTHKLSRISQNNTCTQSIFVLEKQCLPNKDFVFSYTTENYEFPNYVFGRTDRSSTVMLSFIPKFCTLGINDAYKASIEGKDIEVDIDTARAQFIFLLDRSGSMGGKRIEKAKQALVLFIKSLPKDSYFNIVSFGSKSTSLFVQSRKYANNHIEYAVKQVERMQADMGGTQIYNPLAKLLKQKPINGYPKQIFLLIDGAVSNTEQIIKMVKNNNKYARVHSIGIGNGASQSLIIGCAKSGKGLHVFINDQEDPSCKKIIQLLTDSLSAVISQMDLDYDSDVVQSIIPNPKSLPYILKGQIVNFYITFKGQLTNKTNFTFSYEDSQNKLPFLAKIEIDPESSNESFIDRMGHYKMIKVLQQSHANNSQLQDYIYYVKIIDKKQQIIKESIEHQILSEFTAFICVQKQLIDGKYEQIKQLGQVKVRVDNPSPIQLQKLQAKQQCLKSKAEVQWLLQTLESEREVVRVEYAKLQPLIQKAIVGVTKLNIESILAFNNPPASVKYILKAILVILRIKDDDSWLSMRNFLRNHKQKIILGFDLGSVNDQVRRKVQNIISEHPFFFQRENVFKDVVPLFDWINVVIEYSKKIRPLIQKLRRNQQELEISIIRQRQCDKMIVELEKKIKK